MGVVKVFTELDLGKWGSGWYMATSNQKMNFFLARTWKKGPIDGILLVFLGRRGILKMVFNCVCTFYSLVPNNSPRGQDVVKFVCRNFHFNICNFRNNISIFLFDCDIFFCFSSNGQKKTPNRNSNPIETTGIGLSVKWIQPR